MLTNTDRKAPIVTGISPKEGEPGTKVTIRGENLGLNPSDLIQVKICGINCLLSAEWKSSNKIIAHTGQAKGSGDILVVTRSGGVGTCTVKFRGYVVQTGILQDSAVWVDEDQTWSNFIDKNHQTSSIVSIEQDNPLNISDESQAAKFPESLPDMFPDGSGSLVSENYVPEWFLLENHHAASFRDLKAGLAHLKQASLTQNEGPMAFVKSNLTTFMDCQDALADMHTALITDLKNSSTGSITDNLEDNLSKANAAALSLFQEVLGRKDRADATRNALMVLNRFKFLFNLPCSIDRNIKKGDYDLVITDYMRAKSKFCDSEVRIFHKVYQEVERQIVSFQDMLYKKLLQLPSTLEEQKKIIRYLVHLEMKGDPAWECIVHMHQWILNLLNTLKDEHIAKEKELDKIEEEENNKNQNLHSPQGRGSMQKIVSKTPQKVQFVDDLTKVLMERLPDFWRLGQAYLSGKLLKQNNEKPHKVDNTKQGLFKTKIFTLIERFSYYVKAAFLPSSLNNLYLKQREAYGIWLDKQHDAPLAWLPVCVRYIRSCVTVLKSYELPPESIEVLKQISFDIRTNCMSTLLKQAIEDVQVIHHKETWFVETDDELGGTTQLPSLFENLVSETIQSLHEVIQPKGDENEIFIQRNVQREATELSARLLQSFAGCLDKLVNDEQMLNIPREQPKPSRLSICVNQNVENDQTKTLTVAKKIMIVCSNCRYTQYVLLPRLIECLDRHGYPDTEKILQACNKTYRELDGKLFEQYVEKKSNPIVGVLEDNMYAGRFDWNDCIQSAGVRRYVKEALMGMIRVHAEVYSISPRFVQRVMTCLTEAIVDELSRLIQCVMGFNHHGGLQARLELYAVELALAAYKSNNTTQAFQSALNCLPKIESDNDENGLSLVGDLLNQFQRQMGFHLMCFRESA